MSYISEVQIDGSSQPVGSSLYGVCNTGAAVPAKDVTLSSFDYLRPGTTIHVKFLNGNSAPLNDSFTLTVGTATTQKISNPGGNVNWSAGAVISFTYDDVEHTWIVNDSDSANVSVHIEQQYISDSVNAISGAGVTAALNTLGAAAHKGVVNTIIATGANANVDSTDLPTTNAITSYINERTSGLTKAMHFIGITTTEMSDGLSVADVMINNQPTAPAPGDVVLTGGNNLNTHQEYVWVETDSTTHAGFWELLGDEGSYALKSSTGSVISSATFTPDVPGNLTTKDTQIPNIVDVGSAATFTVSNGILNITSGAAPSLGTAITVKEVDTWTKGTAASLSTTACTVIVPEAT